MQKLISQGHTFSKSHDIQFSVISSTDSICNGSLVDFEKPCSVCTQTVVQSICNIMNTEEFTPAGLTLSHGEVNMPP